MKDHRAAHVQAVAVTSLLNHQIVRNIGNDRYDAMASTTHPSSAMIAVHLVQRGTSVAERMDAVSRS
ncbi:hypothetical protein [Nonomuraea sp. NPDC050783]|uniref:hypothetical protein n=1 Tax=Nonomuraea sp. NPDC050783 TaxID=3154634 RepID=UPI003467D715